MSTNDLGGPWAVGLLALHDREFFAELLKNPRRAMKDGVRKGRLSLEDSDIETVVNLIQERTRTPEEALANWDRYHSTGSWRSTDWQDAWPPWPR